MCGICGILYFDRSRRVDASSLNAMTDCLAHRGPDDRGIWINRNIGLGHRRLSIIDLSPAGHQPLSNETGEIWITYNGEVYNFPELRKKLEIKGHQFVSRTDTEVIIHLYEEERNQCLDYLRGMFAFALWDEKKQKDVIVEYSIMYGDKVFYEDTFKGAQILKRVLEDLEKMKK